MLRIFSPICKHFTSESFWLYSTEVQYSTEEDAYTHVHTIRPYIGPSQHFQLVIRESFLRNATYISPIRKRFHQRKFLPIQYTVYTDLLRYWVEEVGRGAVVYEDSSSTITKRSTNGHIWRRHIQSYYIDHIMYIHRAAFTTHPFFILHPPPPPPSPLTPHSSLLNPRPHPSLLTPQPSPLTSHPSPLTPHPSLLPPHPSPLTPPPSLLNPHPSPLTPQPSPSNPSPLMSPRDTIACPNLPYAFVPTSVVTLFSVPCTLQ